MSKEVSEYELLGSEENWQEKFSKILGFSKEDWGQEEDKVHSAKN